MVSPSRSRSSIQVARLITRGRIRKVVLAFQHDVSQYELPATPDEELVAVSSEPYRSVADANDRLQRLEELLRDRRDRRSIFLTVYTRMTRQIRKRIDRGGFADPSWIREYTTTFANYYRRAFLAFERANAELLPDPWRIAFGTAARDSALVIQDALLGINAHINYDLALTLRDVGIDPDRPAKRADHQVVNDVLAKLIDIQQSVLADVYAPAIRDIDALFGRVDERISLFGLSEGRAQAWRVAVVLVDVPWSSVKSAARWLLTTTATGSAAVVLGSWLDSPDFRRLQQFEREEATFDEVMTTLRTRLDADLAEDPV